MMGNSCLAISAIGFIFSPETTDGRSGEVCHAGVRPSALPALPLGVLPLLVTRSSSRVFLSSITMFVLINIARDGLYVLYFHQHREKAIIGHFSTICFQ